MCSKRNVWPDEGFSGSAPTRFYPPFLTARGRASMSGPRRFATLTRVGHDTRP